MARFDHRTTALCCVTLALITGCDRSSQSTDASKNSASLDVSPSVNPSSGAGTRTGDTSRPADGPRWSCKEDSFNCGVMWAGNVRHHRFEFVNVGTETLEIIEAKPGCFCSHVENLTKHVPPQKMGGMVYRLDTSGKLGHIDETITLVTNDPVNPSLVLHMTGEVKLIADQEVIYDASLPNGGDALSLAALRKELATFGKIDPAVHLKRVLRIRNTSGQPLSLTMLPILPEMTPFKSEFKETKPGEEFELTITGDPPYKDGLNKAMIWFKTNIRGMPNFAVPVYATLPQRIEILPQKIVVDPGMPIVLERHISITEDGSKPFKITSLESTEQGFDLRLLPRDPSKPRVWQAILRLPDAQYRPPPYGDIVRFHTSDDEHPTIDIFVLPGQGLEPGEWPKNKPMVFQPGIMPPP